MSQGSRPDRVADQLRAEIAQLLSREVHDPGIGFVTLTRVQVSPDLQSARVFYTALGNEEKTFFLRPVNEQLLAGIQYALGDLKVDDAPGVRPGTK